MISAPPQTPRAVEWPKVRKQDMHGQPISGGSSRSHDSVATAERTRSDSDKHLSYLRELVSSRLRDCGYRSLREVECHVQEELVILFGNVPSFYMKQVAQTVVMNIDEVTGIENHLRVENREYS